MGALLARRAAGAWCNPLARPGTFSPETKGTNMINFSAPLRFRHGAKAFHLGVCPLTKKHRVFHNTKAGFPEEGNTWLVDDAGRCHVLGKDSPNDVFEVE